jgi:hypothetical protein
MANELLERRSVEWAMRAHVLTCFLGLAASAAAADPLFEFHSGFWVNLHHFLCERAASEAVAPGEPEEWKKAVAYYREVIIKRDLLAPESEEINGALAAADMGTGVDALEACATTKEACRALKGSAIIPALEAAAPVYRTRWWAKHDRSNRDWIRAVEPLVSRYGGGFTKEFSRIYAVEWPASAIRVDVVHYAKREGAYTTLEPTHINVSSVCPENQGNAALEILFHEASHALIGKVRDTLSAEVKAENKLFRRRDLWHAVLFYTVGEVVRRQLDGYTPYAFKNGLYDRTWEGLPEILDADWKPYIDGKIDLTTAVRRLVEAYGIPR